MTPMDKTPRRKQAAWSKARQLLPSTVTRLEVIDETGRVYSRWNCRLTAYLQDDNRTLKLFVDRPKGDTNA